MAGPPIAFVAYSLRRCPCAAHQRRSLRGQRQGRRGPVARLGSTTTPRQSAHSPLIAASRLLQACKVNASFRGARQGFKPLCGFSCPQISSPLVPNLGHRYVGHRRG